MASYSTRVDMREVERMLEKLGKQLKNAPAGVRVGYFEGQAYPNGFELERNAVVQEYGKTINHPGGTPFFIDKEGEIHYASKAKGENLPKTKPHTIIIPPRPFLRNAMKAGEKHFHRVFNQEIQRGRTILQALREVGEQMKNAVKDSIDATKEPPNAESTIQSKGSSHPLINDGELKRSIGREIIEK